MTCASLAVSVFTLDDSGLLTSLIISILQQAGSLLDLRGLRLLRLLRLGSITPTHVRLAFLRIHPLQLRT